MATSQEILAAIESGLQAGKTVYVQTYGRTVKVTPKSAAKFKAAGATLFKVGANGSLLMARGRSFDCINYACITIQ